MKYVRKIAFWAAVISGIIATPLSMYALYLTSNVIPYKAPQLRNVSPKAIAELDKINQIPGVLATGIVLTDIHKNERSMLAQRIKDKDLERMFEQYILKFGPKTTAFNFDGPNTLGILDVLNGRSSCMRFDTTVFFHNMPELGNKAKTACLFGLPPIDERYRHYILVLVDSAVTLDDFVPYVEQIDMTKNAIFLSWAQK